MNSGLNFGDSLSIQWRNGFDEICLKHLERGVGDALNELPVGREEEHSLAHFVESSGEIEFVRVVLDEVENGFSAWESEWVEVYPGGLLSMM